jgi:hypothetical protein
VERYISKQKGYEKAGAIRGERGDERCYAGGCDKGGEGKDAQYQK